MIAMALDELVQRVLIEDLGDVGDLTSMTTLDEDESGTARIVAREDAVISGTSVVEATCRAVDVRLQVAWMRTDGDRVEPGDVVGEISGSARSIVTAERTALNFLGRLSAVASSTARMVDLVDGTGVRIVDTRKTTPGLRALEKAAVRHGGGVNHRMGLHDAILVKDNHIALAGGIAAVHARLAARCGHMVRVEVEVDSHHQLGELLALDATRIAAGAAPVVHGVLLDNMTPEQVAEGVAMVRAHPVPVVVEVSGGVNHDTVRGLAEAGPDVISIGALTHSAGCIDFGLDL